MIISDIGAASVRGRGRKPMLARMRSSRTPRRILPILGRRLRKSGSGSRAVGRGGEIEVDKGVDKGIRVVSKE